jgi:hypothetical protein
MIKFADKLDRKYGFEKKAGDEFNLHDYETNGAQMVRDFIWALHSANLSAYDGGNGFSKERLDLLEEQVKLIGAAVQTVFPALEDLDEKIDLVP